MVGSRPRSSSSPQLPRDGGQEPDDVVVDTPSAVVVPRRLPMRANTVSAGEAGAVPYTTMDRLMFTSNPPVKPGADEQERARVLHASALTMARKLYDQQQKTAGDPARGHTRSPSLLSHGSGSLPTSGGEEQLPGSGSLQQAAYRLAQERLAKLQEEHRKERDLLEYYGSPSTHQRGRFGSIKSRLTRKRSSSDGYLLEDRQRSEQIRKQMSLLNNKLTEVDEEKKARDREALLAAAQRNVRAQLQEMDRKLQSKTGRLPQTTMDDWGRKARVAAQARFDAAHIANADKVDIGGGKLVDRSAVEKVAAKKVQPLIDEINERAEEEMERRELERMEQERRREEAAREKMREKEIQELHRKLKGRSDRPLARGSHANPPCLLSSSEQQKADNKARMAEIKQDEKIRKDEARAIKAEHKAIHDGKRQQQPDAQPPSTSPDKKTETHKPAHASPDLGVGRVRSLPSLGFPKRQPKPKRDPDHPTPSSAAHKVRTWFRSRFPRAARAMSASSSPAPPPSSPSSLSPSSSTKKTFIGGAALARLGETDAAGTPLPLRLSSPSPSPVVGEGSTQGNGKGKGKAKAKGINNQHEHENENESTHSVTPTSRSAPSTSSTPRRQSQPVVVSQTTSVRAGVPASASRLSVASAGTAATDRTTGTTGTGSSSEGEVFVEARSVIDDDDPSDDDNNNGHSQGAAGLTSTLTPPRAASGRASPFRESKFSEILE